MIMYRVARPSEYLAITGRGINDVKLAKKAWIWPLQKCTRFNISPFKYSVTLTDAMSAEKHPFTLTVALTIGPHAEDAAALELYAKLMSLRTMTSWRVKDLVQAIIEGETRALAASLPADEIFKGSQRFKNAVFDKVQPELRQFGLVIYNANVKSLVMDGERVQIEAASQAKVNEANCELYKKQREAEAELYQEQKEAEAEKANAEVRKLARQQEADSELYAKRMDARGIVAKAEAEGLYLKMLMKQFGGEYTRVRDYLISKKQTDAAGPITTTISR